MCSRQSIRLRGRLHCQQRRPGGHSALLRSRLHLHHCLAADGPGGGAGVRAGPEEPGGPGSAQSPPEKRQAHEAAADGQGSAGGQLPQSHHPHPGTAPPLATPKSLLHYHLISPHCDGCDRWAMLSSTPRCATPCWRDTTSTCRPSTTLRCPAARSSCAWLLPPTTTRP